MQTVVQGVVLYLLYLLRSVSTVNPACECVVYQSYGGSQGKFTSPNFPKIYPRNINCILYTFIGDIGEIIELTFLEFDLKMPASNSRCTDYLRFFLNLDRPEVSMYSTWEYDVCGNITTIEKKHYSSGRSLILEFHSDGLPANHTGFRGLFTFLDEKQYTTDCIRETGTQCIYYCQSNNSTKTGKFFSPRYPQHYPGGANCQYIFTGLPGERILIVFQNIQLHHIDGSCTANPDVVTVHDGMDKAGAVIGRYCNVHNQVELLSSTEYLFVDFYSDQDHERQGFAATFRFCSSCLHDTYNPPKTPPGDGRLIPGLLQPTTSGDLAYPTSGALPCDEHFSSSVRKSGTFASPNFPHPYPSQSTCRYTFQGEGQERVQLKFTHLDLYYPRGNAHDPHDCEGSDSVTVYIVLNGKTSDLGSYCGSKVPKMLMSNEPKMTVVFQSGMFASSVSGFKATYSFVSNFGISSGKQDARYVCGFNFFSAASRNGTFTSPNYPGFYPRNTECHYLFYGQKGERVHISFKSFDVDGIPPRCREDSQSDYLEFSNFNTLDRKMRRYCGSSKRRLPQQDITSDKEFFRAMFKSNDVYDSAGFFATYEFKRDKEYNGYRPINRKPNTERSSTDSSTTSISANLRFDWTWLLLTSFLLIHSIAHHL